LAPSTSLLWCELRVCERSPTPHESKNSPRARAELSPLANHELARAGTVLVGHQVGSGPQQVAEYLSSASSRYSLWRTAHSSAKVRYSRAPALIHRVSSRKVRTFSCRSARFEGRWSAHSGQFGDRVRRVHVVRVCSSASRACGFGCARAAQVQRCSGEQAGPQHSVHVGSGRFEQPSLERYVPERILKRVLSLCLFDLFKAYSPPDSGGTVTPDGTVTDQ